MKIHGADVRPVVGVSGRHCNGGCCIHKTVALLAEHQQQGAATQLHAIRHHAQQVDHQTGTLPGLHYGGLLHCTHTDVQNLVLQI